MIEDKRLKYIISEDGYDFYLFTPSVSCLYYPEQIKREEPPHRYASAHKAKMLRYILMGGYNILYAAKNDVIASYIIFTKSNKNIIRGTDKRDYYTIYLWTYPEYRGQGLGTVMANTMLEKIGLDYRYFYKTIVKTNLPSIRVAEKSGFKNISEARREGVFKIICPVESDGSQYLFRREKNAE